MCKEIALSQCSFTYTYIINILANIMLYFAVVINSSLKQFDIILLWGSDVKVGQSNHHNKCSGIKDDWEKGIVQCRHTILDV